MKVSQSTTSVLFLLLTTAVLAPAASAVSASAPVRSSVSSPSAQLISQAGSMSLGGSGPLVSQLQEDLASLGYYSGTNTGYFGSITEAAVIRFQRDVGITADGRVGPETQEAIAQRIGTGAPAVRPPESSEPLLRRGDYGNDVVGLQVYLRREGYFSGETTGYFGPATEQAVLTVQRNNGLVEDGIAGPAVLAIIRK